MRIRTLLSFSLIFSLLFAFIPLVRATTETRYMRGDTHTINGLLAYQLGTSQSNTAQNVKKSTSPLKTPYWGIRVYKRDSGGSETEITSGTPVAQVNRGPAGQGLQSNTWNCPETALSSTDAIVVKVYHKWTDESWVEIAKFITEQLGASQLNSSTWTAYYWTKTAYVGFPVPRAVDSWFYWGTNTYNSRIEDFSWSIEEEEQEKTFYIVSTVEPLTTQSEFKEKMFSELGTITPLEVLYFGVEKRFVLIETIEGSVVLMLLKEMLFSFTESINIVSISEMTKEMLFVAKEFVNYQTIDVVDNMVMIPSIQRPWYYPMLYVALILITITIILCGGITKRRS